VDQTQFMTFFVKDIDGKLVAAKYLRYKGQLVSDPNIQIAQRTRLYDASGNLLPHQDVEGFLIVPADFSVEKGIEFAKTIQQILNTPESEGGGVEAADGAMVSAFASYDIPVIGKTVVGPQDLQRSYNGTTGRFVPAFTNAASFYFGLVGSYAGYSLASLERGGGWLNLLKSLWHSNIDTSGPFGNPSRNASAISGGYDFAHGLPGGSQVAI
jgi:hypothetical protein